MRRACNYLGEVFGLDGGIVLGLEVGGLRAVSLLARLVIILLCLHAHNTTNIHLERGKKGYGQRKK